MTEFTRNVITIIQHIPKGKVMTYGQIAVKAGNHLGARQVSRILHSMSEKYDLPWHRVINSKGMIGLKGNAALIQKSLLIDEGIEVEGVRISLEKYLFKV